MPDADLDPLRKSVSEALSIATKADNTATKALEISKQNANQLMGLAVSQQRTEAGLNEHRIQSETRHGEVLAAINGAMTTDKAQAEAILAVKAEGATQADALKKLESKLTNADVGKIAGGVTALLVAVAGAITLAATQLAPVLPSIAQAKYAQPIVVYAPASAAPVGSK